jgi:ribosomal protein S18 acetylase RimI-like enzyme
MQYRVIDPGDFDSCVSILPAAFQSPHFKAKLGYLSIRRTGIVAIDDSYSVAGFLTYDEDFLDGRAIYFRTLIVRENARRQGIGLNLTRAGLKIARKLEARRVFLDTLTGSDSLADSHIIIPEAEKLGFKPAGHILNMHDEGGRYEIFSLSLIDP